MVREFLVQMSEDPADPISVTFDGEWTGRLIEQAKNAIHREYKKRNLIQRRPENDGTSERGT